MSYYFPLINYAQVPLYYWNYWQNEPTTPQIPEIPEETRQIRVEESANKKQIEKETLPKKKIPKTSKINKRRSKKKLKPKKKKKKDMSFSGKSQKQNRNYPSIVCRMFLLFVANHTRIGEVLQSISKHNKIYMTQERFLKIFNQTFDLKKSYVRKELIEEVCFSESYNKEFSLAFRVLLRKFLKQQIVPVVFKSRKLNKKVKVKQSKFASKVYTSFFETERQKMTEKGSTNQQIIKREQQIQQVVLKIQNVEVKIEN